MKSTLVEAHAHKEEEGGGGTRETWLQKDKPNNNLELRLGISATNNSSGRIKELTTMPSPSTPRLMTSPSDGLVLNGFCPSPSQYYGPRGAWFAADPGGGAAGFIHPWSLAARQQKAVFEQAHHRSETPSLSNSPAAAPRLTPPTPPPIIGWPPVRASRRNLGGSSSPVKPEMDHANVKDAKKAKMGDGDGEEKKCVANHQYQARPMMPAAQSMFVKVNMEGFAVGRKINLKAYDSYESLSRALQKMFTNFLSTNYTKNSAQEEQDEDHNPDYVLLYEDHEGDRMLVGDVPWELFITSVKRLYIAHSPKTPKDEEKVKDEQAEQQLHD